MSKIKPFLSGVLMAGGFDYLITALRFFLTMYLSRLLLPSEYGVITFIQVFTGFIIVFQQVGISSIVIKSKNSNPSYYNQWHTIALIIGISQCVILLVASYPIDYFFTSKQIFWPIALSSLTFIISSLSIVPHSILDKELKFGQTGLFKLYAFSFSSVVTIICVNYGLSYWSLILQEIAYHTALTFIYNLKTNLSLRKLNKYSFYKRISESKQILSGVITFSFLNYFSKNLDNIVIGKNYASSDLGVYNRAFSLVNIASSLIPTIINRVAFPILSKTENTKQLSAAVNKINHAVILVCLPITAVFVLYSKDIVTILWGDSWIDTAIYLPYFGILVLSSSQTSLLINNLLLFNHEKRIKPLSILIASVNITTIIIGSFFSIETMTFLICFVRVTLLWNYYIYNIYHKIFRISTHSILTEYIPITIFGGGILIAQFVQKTEFIPWLLIALVVSTLGANRQSIKEVWKVITIEIKS